MSENYVAQGPSFAVLPTVHGYHYAFKKFQFFCVILYLSMSGSVSTRAALLQTDGEGRRRDATTRLLVVGNCGQSDATF